jgi:hypothetical protein
MKRVVPQECASPLALFAQMDQNLVRNKAQEDLRTPNASRLRKRLVNLEQKG